MKFISRKRSSTTSIFANHLKLLIACACVSAVFSFHSRILGVESQSRASALLGTFRLRAETDKGESIVTGHGTAFAINLCDYGYPRPRYLLTACHVVRDHDSELIPDLKVEVRNGNVSYWLGCSVISFDEKRDLALLESNADLPSTSRFAAREPENGNPLIVIGSPAGIPLKIFEAQMLEKDGYELSTAYVAFFKQGCSGGPVFNNSKDIVGVAVAGIKKGQGMDPHTCLFVPLPDVKEFVSASMPRQRARAPESRYTPPVPATRVTPRQPQENYARGSAEAGDADVELATIVEPPPQPARREYRIPPPVRVVEPAAEVIDGTGMLIP
ncbi:MAG TPA: serine protease [Planctomycetota bacterium]|nr:serine protease [Planctomycetota bacterium]